MDTNSTDKRCILAYTSMYIDPTGDIRPCCVSFPFEEKLNWNEYSTLEEIYNSPQFRKLRKSMHDGNPLSMCDICYKGGTDLMNTWNKQWGHKFDDPELYDENFKVKNIKYLDGRFSNICNFKCRMCGPALSSSWYDDYKLIKGEKGTKFVESLSTINGAPVDKFTDKDLESIEHINVAGGEPFITDDFFKLVERFSAEQASKITMYINTNLSTLYYKKQDILKILSKFKSVMVAVSCDGYGEIVEYQRTGFNSERFWKNLDTLNAARKIYPGLGLNIEYTITNLNMFHVFDFLEYIDSLEGIDAGLVHFHWANGPINFAPCIIPENLKKKVTEFYNINLSINNYSEHTTKNLRDFLRHINQPVENVLSISWDNDINIVENLDKVRNTDYKKLFPWMEEILNYQKNLKII